MSMSAQAHRDAHARRIHRVLAHIDQHVDQDLDLGTLAGVAHFSTFHFHRLFHAWMGETLGDYLRRRRLEVAATRMAAQPRVPVFDIAIGVGFGSAEAFARAFKAHFGLTPRAWRTGRSRLCGTDASFANDATLDANDAKSKIDQVAEGSADNNQATGETSQRALMNVALMNLDPQPIAYLSHVGPYGSSVAGFWQTEALPWMAAHGWLDRPRLGISRDAPFIGIPTKRRYDAGVAIPDGWRPPAPALHTTIPGGCYAVHHVHGDVSALLAAWTTMLRDWIPDSGLQLDDRPCFERYPAGGRPDAATGTFACDICVPVAPL